MGWKWLSIATATAVLAVLAVGGVVVSRLVGPDMPWPFRDETTGFVFVESPEVYTRQRLVNDRYLQDAWLRSKLAEIDDPGTLFIDRRVAQEDRAGAGIRLGAAAGDAKPDAQPGAAAAPEPSARHEADTVPFGTRFALQSAARDKIRQLVLENALDDRHDLSGNTVFGLKFDTAVIPGSNTWRNPTVVVRVVEDSLIGLRNDTARLAGHYLRAGGVDLGRTATPEDIGIVAKMNRHFDAWRGNLEERLNSFKSEIRPACFDPKKKKPRPEGPTPLCVFSQDRKIALDPDLRGRLNETFGQADVVDDALEFELRLPPRESGIASDFLPRIQRAAENSCSELNGMLRTDTYADGADVPRAAVDTLLRDPSRIEQSVPVTMVRDGKQTEVGRSPRSLEDFLEQKSHFAPNPYPLPGPWGQFFDLRASFRPPGAANCDASVDLSLLEKEIGVIFLREPLNHTAYASPGAGQTAPAAPAGPTYGDILSRANWQSLPCGLEDCLTGNLSVWIDLRDPSSEARNAAAEVLDTDTLRTLLVTLDHFEETDHEGSAPCAAEGAPAGATGRELWFASATDTGGDWSFWGESSPSGGYQARCMIGYSFQFRLGAYRFLQRMTEVESYTYAAFPRGDVTGVVTETSSTVQLDAGLEGLGGIGASAGLGSSSRTRDVEAVPSIVNFAAGGEGHGFDFGWSIIKEGRKKSMLASQLVLISVPAYLDEIELEIWKGFLDVDAPHVGKANTAAPGTSDNGDPLADFIDGITPAHLTLKVPPDYAALDGIVIGTQLVNGPKIRDRNGTGHCYAVIQDEQLTLPIAGSRLWRSTLVTLDGLKADRIEVMPDMRGILASFNSPDLTGKSRKPAELSVGPHELVVWTSEGHSPTTIELCTPQDAASETAAAESAQQEDSAAAISTGAAADAAPAAQTAAVASPSDAPAEKTP